MGKVVAVVNQKGGVGKTSTCINMCCGLDMRGKRTLLCDCDPQGNATSGMGLSKSLSPNTYDVLINGAEPKTAIFESKYGKVMPSNRELAGAMVELIDIENREYVLKRALETLRDDYDYIIIDCPPSLELLTLNALCAADALIVPVQCEYFALEGLTDLMSTIKTIKMRLNPQLELEGILLTMYDSRTNLSVQVEDEIKKFFGDKVFCTKIPRNVRISEAPSHGKPVIAYDRLSKGSRAYMHFVNEYMKTQTR
jgi:chromosome partitioning protein